jgi:hypothetical protein
MLDSDWKPGDHVSVFAPTDSGKTYLVVRGLLPLWPEDYPCLVIDVKGDDPSLRGVGKPVDKLPGGAQRRYLEHRQCYRLVVRETASKEDRERAQRKIIAALRTARAERGWIIEINEVRALSDARPPALGLAPYLEQLWLRGRPHVTLIAETQRPAFVPGSMYDQPTHVYIGQILDKRARDRLHEIGGHTDQIEAGISQLQEYEFVYVNRKTKAVEIVKLPPGLDRAARGRGG